MMFWCLKPNPMDSTRNKGLLQNLRNCRSVTWASKWKMFNRFKLHQRPLGELVELQKPSTGNGPQSGTLLMMVWFHNQHKRIQLVTSVQKHHRAIQGLTTQYLLCLFCVLGTTQTDSTGNNGLLQNLWNCRITWASKWKMSSVCVLVSKPVFNFVSRYFFHLYKYIITSCL